MKMFKKVAILALSLGMVGGLVACGGGGDNGTDNGNAKGTQVTKEEWTTAITNAYNADNVTINCSMSGGSEEDGVVWTGVATSTIKIADGKIYEKMSTSETQNGQASSYTDETYIGKIDGTYYEYYKDSIDTLDWVSYVCEEAESDPAYLTAGGYALSYLMGISSLESYIIMYDYMTFDATTGEYKWLEGEVGEEMYTLAIKILDGKLYTVNERMELGANYEEAKMVFSNYGTTTVNTMFGVDEEEDSSSDSSQSGTTGGEVGGDGVGQCVDESGWIAALSPADDDYEYAQSVDGVHAVTYKIDGDKIYSKQAFAERYYSVEDGKYYLYAKQSDAWTKTELSATEYAMEIGMIKADWSDAFPYGNFTFNAETGCYEAASIVFGGEVALTNVNIKIVNGKLAQMSYTMEDMELSLVFTYQEITLTLPEVGGEVGGDVGGEVVMPALEAVDAAGWAAAITATRAATNFTATVTMEAYALGSGMTGPAMTGVATMSIADNKGYVEMTTTMAGMGSSTQYSYCGNVDGKNYNWESYDDGATWYCEEIGNAINIDGDWMVSELFCDEMTFETATFDAETGIYSYTTADGETYSIGFANGKVVYHSYSYTEDMGSVMELTEWYVITYGNAVVGELPPVTVS